MLEFGNLNLARKWRSKQFDQVVGQELSIRMLKNSLFRSQLFPVYLFSGQRGCGKTTTARIFAAAVNCQLLLEFQKNPKEISIPCLICPSCKAMSEGQHPDFFELDAASHTGIDTIRQLIDSAQLLPVMGRKKIYLIDEAHMLSKASFNALLKILEEPPCGVLFILATTDLHKIIETVRSRCFQLFFGPIVHDQMYQHLLTICAQEDINAQESALRLIAAQSDGSLRDALNLLEQVRFSTAKVTKDSVLSILGYIDDELLVQLLEKIGLSTPQDLLSFMQQIRLESYAPERVWERLLVALRALLWMKYGIRSTHLAQYEDRLKHLIASCPWSFWLTLSEKLHEQQLLFNRTSAKYSLLEMILLQASHNRTTSSGTNGAAAQVAPGYESATVLADEEDDDGDEDNQENEADTCSSLEKAQYLWSLFVKDIGRLQDPLLTSVLQRGVCVSYDNHELTLQFSKQFVFFKESVEAAREVWIPALYALFGKNIGVTLTFDAPAIDSVKKERDVMPLQKKNYQKATSSSMNQIAQDSQKWPLATLLGSYFPGTFTEIGGKKHV